MLLREETIKRLGYDIPVSTPSTKKLVIVCCDYCNSIIEKTYQKYLLGRKEVDRDCCSNINCLKQKRQDVMMKKYGVKTAGDLSIGTKQSEHTKQKRVKSIQKTLMETKGVVNVFQLKEVKDKIRQTSINKYGTEHPFQNQKIQQRAKDTFVNRYGVEHALQNQEFKEKAINTTIKRYGYRSYTQTQEFKDFMYSRRTTFEGKTFQDISDETGKAYSTVVEQIAKYGYEYAISIDKNMSAIEKRVKDWLIEEKIEYKDQVTLDRYRCDFIINNLAIELNGNYWHSDKILKDKNYHRNKRDYYIKQNYIPLFFCEDEIIYRFNIVKSIIKNKLNMSNKIYGRECKIVNISKKEAKAFLLQNHLMGCGRGESIGLLYNNKVVAIMQSLMNNNDLHISRFTNVLNHSVLGGFSKLLKATIKKNKPTKVINFVDLRYGNGNNLKNLGFNLVSSHLSFNWTNYKYRYHRMKFPKNTGYTNGLYKIWDCGQAKYVMDIIDTPS